MSQNPFAAPPPAGAPQIGTREPWGLLATIVWGVAGFCIWFMAQFAVILGYVMTHPETGDAAVMRAMATNGFLLALVTIVAGPAWIAVMAIAARWRGWRVADYLALVAPRRSEFAFGFASMAALLIAFDVLTYATGRGLEYYDVETVDRIVARLDQEHGHFSALLMGVIESAPFQKRRENPSAIAAKSPEPARTSTPQGSNP